jgi:hypothetical protein
MTRCAGKAGGTQGYPRSSRHTRGREGALEAGATGARGRGARLAAEADAARIKAEAEEAERERLRVKEEEERLTAQLALEAAAKAKRDARYARARRAPAACRQAANPRLSASHKARRNLDGLFALKPVNSRA